MITAASPPPPPPRVRLDAITRAAVADLEPIVVVNRRLDAALDQVDGASSEPFPTIHTDPRTDVRTQLRRIYRSVNERVRGTHGDGESAGHTVYGSLRFVPVADAREGADAVVAALRRQGDVGIRAYGPVSFVLSPDVMRARASFAADDTGVSTAKVHAPDDVAQVVADRIERDSPSGSAPRVDELLAMPASAARDAVRGWLLTDEIGRSTYYMEAQVRRMAPHDVLAAVVDTRDPARVDRRPHIDPGPTPTRTDVERLRRELDRHHVPTHVIQP